MPVTFSSLNDTKRLWFSQQPGNLPTKTRKVYFTRYAIMYRLAKKRLLLFNTLSGAVDYISGIEPELLADILHGFVAHDKSNEIRKYFFKRGYLFLRKADDKKAHAQTERHFRAPTNIHAFSIVMTTKCNFNCYYCFERNIIKSRRNITQEQLISSIDFIKSYVKKNKIARKDVDVYLFGGEPLLPELKDKVLYVLKEAKKNKWTLGLTTNGYSLVEYLPILKKYKKQIRYIYVTIDGPEDIHNLRRTHRSPHIKGTFRQITKGLNSVIDYGIPCIINTEVDKKNIKHLPRLYRYFRRKRWPQKKNVFFRFGSVTDFVEYEKYMLNERDAGCLSQMVFSFGGLDTRYTPSKCTDYLDRVLFENYADYPRTWGCDSHNSMFFNVDSKIYHCSIFSSSEDSEIGRFYPTPKIYTRKRRKLKAICARKLTMCKGCKAAFLCGGPCPARYRAENNPINKMLCPGEERIEHDVQDYIKKNKKQIEAVLKSLGKPDLVIKNPT